MAVVVVGLVERVVLVAVVTMMAGRCRGQVHQDQQEHIEGQWLAVQVVALTGFRQVTRNALVSALQRWRLNVYEVLRFNMVW